MVRSVWKGKIVPNSIQREDISNIILKDRNLFLFSDFVGLNLKVYNGRSWLDMTIDIAQIGFNLSVFVFTRTMIVLHNLKKGKKTLQGSGRDKKKTVINIKAVKANKVVKKKSKNK